MKISIVIPCYNESQNIKYLIRQANLLKKNFNFIFVNNGSTDKSDLVFKSLKIPTNCKYIKITKNKGYGYGIKEGLKKANDSLIGWMHGDLQQDLSILNKTIPLIKKEPDKKDFFVKGLRTKRKFFDTIFTICMAIIMTIIFKKKHWDVAGQPSIIKKKFLKKILTAPNDFSFDFYVYNLFIMKGIKILRFEAPFKQRKFGTSSWNNGLFSKIKHSIRTFRYIIGLKNLVIDSRKP
tara:strand:- start:3920 stop:4627 length:708 start_codon:yes stop_codon:yes gene_type:complete